MKISKSLIIITLILIFQFQLKCQSEINFDTINFNVLTNLEENQVIKLRMISIGCFHMDQYRIEFKKKMNKIEASLFNDSNYDIFGASLMVEFKDSLLNSRYLNKTDIDYLENVFHDIFLISKEKPRYSTNDYFDFFDDRKRHFFIRISFCNQNFINKICNVAKQ